MSYAEAAEEELRQRMPGLSIRHHRDASDEGSETELPD